MIQGEHQMTAREKRRAQRLKTLQVSKTSLHSSDSNSFHIGLSPLESWELLSRISKESWYLETAQVAPDFLDKSKVRILRGDRDVSDK
jgi:hypothetical protein